MLERMTQMWCGKCGVRFDIPTVLDNENKLHARTWYCPNGHPRVYGETTADKLKRELQREQNARHWADRRADYANRDRDHAENRVTAYKGHNTRLKKRLAKGKCPACQTQFGDLAQHMDAEHPGYGGASNG